MTEQEWIDALRAEGYANVSVANLEDNFDDTHTHDVKTVHVILLGSLTLIENGVSTTLLPGQRFEIPAGTTHTAKTGPEGCRMVVAFS